MRIFNNNVARSLLGDCFRECGLKWPFTVTAIVLLPDHLHTIWTLPRGDINFSARWNLIKKEFTKKWLNSGGKEAPISGGRQREHRRGIWQPRFWEHTIENEIDFERHFDYVHYNPVKHKLVSSPKDWKWSSFQRWVRAGVYPEDWACGTQPEFDNIDKTVGEI